MDIYTLTNSNGARARITRYGGIVMSLEVPDRDGNPGDVVLGHDAVDGYMTENNPYFGCLVGRCGNRIGKARFTLDGQEYELAKNAGNNHLHGGVKGFDKLVWDAREMTSTDGPALELTLESPDMDEGYPGNLSVKATYVLTEANALQLDYEATTDKPTICNLTQHSYFNLAGAASGDILDHEVMIAADAITATDDEQIPTGEIRSVARTPLDFNSPVRIGERIDADDEQLRFAQGYDHNFVIRGKAPDLRHMARVSEASSGRVMDVHSTAPGLQFYTGNYLDGSIVGKGGVPYRHRWGFCMEPQHFPDSPNHPEFESVVLRPGETYRHRIVYAFSTL